MPEPKKKLLEAVDRMSKLIAAAEKTKKITGLEPVKKVTK
ncbi:unnamed protein product [marine sediment metagenome]|uniref:Uncharacterized protein n=1 Tax=marine sediment metagenome TaxID=412755 RepID=X1THV3_9ZZZZ